MVSKLKNPIIFQGNLMQKRYFEGWYFKQVSADKKTSISIIPGISLNEEDAHSFVQYFLAEEMENGEIHTSNHYFRYPLSLFHYHDKPFLIKIGPNIFTESFLSVSLQNKEAVLEGKIGFGKFQPIRTSLLSPSIMGPFSYVPNMECYHGVISMDHSLTGKLEIQGRTVSFLDGRGYLEKDWGISFPEKYIWLQSNHFSQKKTSLFFSIAKIPYHITSFEGFIANFQLNGKEYRFATYNQSTCFVERIGQERLSVTLENKEAVLQIEAELGDLVELPAPENGRMSRVIEESLSGKILVSFHNLKTGTYYEDAASPAGVEIVNYE